jgi:hypothetical protein
MPQLGTEAHQPEEVSTPSIDRGPSLVAVGVPYGRWRDPRDAHLPSMAIIRQGERFVVVELEVLDVFLPAIRPRYRSELLATAEEAGAEDPVQLVDAVLDAGLLLPFGADPGEDVERLRRLRLQPVGIGLGDDGKVPGAYRIASHDLRPLLECDPVTYAVWAASDGRSIGRICELVGAAYGVAADEVLHHIVGVLPQLLESGAAFLDVSPGGEGL